MKFNKYGYSPTVHNTIIVNSNFIGNTMGHEICSICQNTCRGHDWIEIDEIGNIVDCSIINTENADPENFTHYVAYNAYGGVDRRISKEDLEVAMRNSIWEFNVNSENSGIDVRLKSQYELGRNPDSAWHSWYFTLVPEIL